MSEKTTSTAQDNTVAVETTSAENNQTENSTQETQSTQSTEQTTESTTTEQAGAPEQYADFSMPEGFSAPIDDFKTWAKENNMTQESAQSVVDFYTNKVAPQMQAQHEAQVSEWKKESIRIHGNDGVEQAKIARDLLLSKGIITKDGFYNLMDQGVGDHPEMIAIMKQLRTETKESEFIDSKTSESKPKTLGQIMYPNMK